MNHDRIAALIEHRHACSVSFLDHIGQLVVVVGQTPDVVNTDELEDVLKSGGELHIRQFAEGRSRAVTIADIPAVVERILDISVFPRRVRQVVQTRTGLQIGVVLLAQTAVDTRETDHSAQLQFVDTRDAVHDPTFEIIRQLNTHVLVHDELHRFHLVETAQGEEDTR